MHILSILRFYQVFSRFFEVLGGNHQGVTKRAIFILLGLTLIPPTARADPWAQFFQQTQGTYTGTFYQTGASNSAAISVTLGVNGSPSSLIVNGVSDLTPSRVNGVGPTIQLGTTQPSPGAQVTVSYTYSFNESANNGIGAQDPNQPIADNWSIETHSVIGSSSVQVTLILTLQRSIYRRGWRNKLINSSEQQFMGVVTKVIPILQTNHQAWEDHSAGLLGLGWEGLLQEALIIRPRSASFAKKDDSSGLQQLQLSLLSSAK